MPKISDHWVRLSEKDLHFILDAAPEGEDGESDEQFIQRQAVFIAKVGDLIEDGLETW